MTVEFIRNLLHGTRPFRVRMVSGRVIDVPHPDFAMMSPEATSLALYLERGQIEVVRLNQIESIEAPDGTSLS